MESSKNQNETQLCGVCQTFYGTRDSNFLCSTCFKVSQSSHEPKLPIKEEVQIQNHIKQEFKDEKKSDVKHEQTDQDKCWNCKKKVGAVKISCKCGFIFCQKHRHAEAHNCTFDYFANQQQKLAKENPLVQGKKLEFL